MEQDVTARIVLAKGHDTTFDTNNKDSQQRRLGDNTVTHSRCRDEYTNVVTAVFNHNGKLPQGT